MSDTDPCNEDDFEESENEERLQDRLGTGQSYDPRSLREQAANMFAAELLMPRERLRALYLDERVEPATLSDRFGVSLTALLQQLTSLLKPVPLEVETDVAPLPQTQPAVRKPFDDFQHAAIAAPTPALIVAGPGSGKTSTLIGRVAHLVSTQYVPPQAILALTFSRKAAQEMQERLQTVLPDALPRVCTFHAYCADLLRQYGSHVGLRQDFSLLDEAESYTLLQQQSHAMQLHHYQRLHNPAAYFPDLLKAISRAKDELVTPEAYQQLAQRLLLEAGDDAQRQEQAGRSAEVAHVYTLYQAALAQRGDTDFGGLLMLTLHLFRAQPDILRDQQQQYLHILVDEFQDVNRASGVLLRELAGAARRVWVVGDTNQAIYRFRGASPANLSRFTHDFPGAVILPLSRNYRSRSDLVKIAESFRCKQLEFGEEPGKNEATRLTHAETSITLAHAADEASELEGILHDIQQRHAQGYAYRDMVILCRSRAHVQKITRALTSRELPVAERSNLLEQEFIRDTLTPLLLLTDASGSGLLRLRNAYALPQRDLETLLRFAHEQHVPPMQLVSDGEAPLAMSVAGRQKLLRIAALLERLHTCSSIWSLLSHYLFLENYTTIRNTLNRSEQQGQRADYDALLQLARHYDTQYERDMTPEIRHLFGERATGFLEYLRLLLLLRQEGTTKRDEQDENAEQSRPDTLRVMTVHASKGLEFPIVYMPGLTTQRFPAMARYNPVPSLATLSQLLQDKQEQQEQQETEQQAHESSEACLFYVGITRARDALVLSYSDRYGKRTYKPSPYLDALRAGLSEERITQVNWKFSSSEDTVDEDDEMMPRDSTSITAQLSEDFIRAMSSSQLHASDVEAYHRCPRQFAYSRLYHFETEPSGYQLFHKATQHVMKQLHAQQDTQSVQDAQNNPDIQGAAPDVRALYTQHWQSLGGDKLPFATLYERHGQQVLVAAQREQHDVTYDERQQYTSCEVEIAGHHVQVTIDRIEQREVQAIQQSLSSQKPAEHGEQETSITPTPSAISSTKAVSRTPASSAPTSTAFKRTRFGKSKERPEAEMRDLFYTLAYRQQYPGQSVNLQHQNLSTGETTPLTMTPRKERNLQTEVEQALNGMARHEYPAKPEEASRCLTCPFSFTCPT
jgi:superfamily I DNA/RNA helicase